MLIFFLNLVFLPSFQAREKEGSDSTIQSLSNQVICKQDMINWPCGGCDQNGRLVREGVREEKRVMIIARMIISEIIHNL